MAEITRMRNFLMIITSVRVKIHLILYERSLDSFWSAIAWDQLKIHIGGNHAHTQDSKAHNFC